ncbi:MAG: hypothetical protein ACJ741_03775 [Pyrinomonadaceae bacterium]
MCARLTAATLSLACPAAVWAQCAMCQTSAANVDPAGVKYLNFAVFLLMMPPATIFCGFFYAAYKRRNAPGENEETRDRGERETRSRTFVESSDE